MIFGSTRWPRLFLPLLSSLILTVEDAAAQNWSWASALTGGDARSRSIVHDAAGNLFVSGSFAGTIQVGTFSLTAPAGTTRSYVARYTLAGVCQWATALPAETATLAIDAADNLYAAGSFSGSATFGATTLTSAGGTDAYVARLTTAGAITRATRGGGAADDRVQAIATDPTGNVVIAGEFATTTTFGSTTLTTNGLGAGNAVYYPASEVFIARLSSAGSWTWARQTVTAGFLQTTVGAIAVNASGNIALTGSFQGPVNFGSIALTMTVSSGSPSPDAYVAYLTSAGAWTWARAFGGEWREYGRAVKFDGAGNVVVAGTFGSTTMQVGNTTLTNTTSLSLYAPYDEWNLEPCDIFVGRLSPIGVWQWATQAGGGGASCYLSGGTDLDCREPGYDSVTGLEVDAAGDVYCTGSTTSRNATFGATTFNADYMRQYVAKASSTGVWQWVLTASVLAPDGDWFAGHQNRDSYSSVASAALTLTDRVVLTGSYAGPATFGATNPQGIGVSTTAVQYSSPPAPVVSTLSPSAGPAGATITINGNYFVGATAVNFNGVPAASFTVQSINAITAVVPAAATTGKVTVTTPSGSAQSVGTFRVAPTITSFTPTSGAIGATVTISGTGMLGTTAVKFNGVNCPVGTFTVVNNSTITATVPVGATTGKISVVNPGGTGTSATNFTVGPMLTGFTPVQGAPGSVVLIFGQNFTSPSIVKFNGVTAVTTYNSAKQLTAVVPTGATSGPLTVTTSAGTATSATPYTITGGTRPIITTFSPTTNVLAGTLVTITGSSFTGATAVRFNNVNATSFTVNSATSITAPVPAGATAGRVYVTTPAGMAQSTSSLMIIQPPTVTSFSPTSGPAGTLVTINGTNLTNASAVTFGGLAATYTVVSSGRITATVPAGAPSGPIRVTTVAGTATSAVAFTRTGPRAAADEPARVVVELFPNPAHEAVEVQLTGLEAGEVPAELTDLLGRSVRRMVLRAGVTRLSVVELPAGTYVLRAAGQVRRLIVE